MELYKSSFVPNGMRFQRMSVEATLFAFLRKKYMFLSKMKMYLHVELDLIFFTYGDRFLNIIHTKLRHNCALNNDLFRCNIINSPLCSCGKLEDTYHYFFTCNKYKDARNVLFNDVFQIVNLNIVNTHVLLWGDSSISDNENKHLFTLVYNFIKNTERFN